MDHDNCSALVGTMDDVSEQGEDARPGTVSMTLADLARAQGVVPVEDAKELSAEIWESDEELDEFLADLRQSRHASLG